MDKKKHFIDSKVTDKKEKTFDDVGAYDLIMKDKDRLLSFDEPVRFIFFVGREYTDAQGEKQIIDKDTTK